MLQLISIILALSVGLFAAAPKPEQVAAIQAASVDVFRLGLTGRLQLSNGKCPNTKGPVSICVHCDQTKPVMLYCPPKDAADSCKGPGPSGTSTSVNVAVFRKQTCALLYGSDLYAVKICKEAVQLDGRACATRYVSGIAAILDSITAAPKLNTEIAFVSEQGAMFDEYATKTLDLYKGKCLYGRPICIACAGPTWKRAVAFYCKRSDVECVSSDTNYSLDEIMLTVEKLKYACYIWTEEKESLESCRSHVDAVAASGEMCRIKPARNLAEISRLFRKPAAPFKRNDAFRKAIGEVSGQLIRNTLKLSEAGNCPNGGPLCIDCSDSQGISAIFCGKPGPGNSCDPHSVIDGTVVRADPGKLPDVVCPLIFNEYADGITNCKEHIKASLGIGACKAAAFSSDLAKVTDLFLVSTKATS